MKKIIEDNLVDIEINVEEKQTGTLNAGVSFGTLDGFAVVVEGLVKEILWNWKIIRLLVNTSEDKTIYFRNY